MESDRHVLAKKTPECRRIRKPGAVERRIGLESDWRRAGLVGEPAGGDAGMEASPRFLRWLGRMRPDPSTGRTSAACPL